MVCLCLDAYTALGSKQVCLCLDAYQIPWSNTLITFPLKDVDPTAALFIVQIGRAKCQDDTSYDCGTEDDDGKNSQPRNEPLLALCLLLIVLYLARNGRLATLELSPDTI